MFKYKEYKIDYRKKSNSKIYSSHLNNQLAIKIVSIFIEKYSRQLHQSFFLKV